MRWLHRVAAAWLNVWRRKQVETDLHDEFRDHFELEVAENVRRGMSRDEAEAAARVLLGPDALYEEQCRDARAGVWLDILLRDVRLAIRYLRRTPALTGIALLTLGIAIGANTAIFTLLDKMVLRPLPVADPSSLRTLTVNHNNISYPNLRDMRANAHLLSFAAARVMPVSIAIANRRPERRWSYEVSGNYFDLLGVRAYRGSFFHADDDHPLSAPYLVVSYRFWRSELGGDENICGKVIHVNTHPFTVVAVAPPGFFGTEVIIEPDVWAPLNMQPAIEPQWPTLLQARDAGILWIIARLHPGVTDAAARTELSRIAASLAREYPESDRGMQLFLEPIGLIGGQLRGPMQAFTSALMVLAGLVLLLACVNLAGMLLARASDRKREMAIRLSIGAGRLQLFRQLFTEMTILALAGGLAGIALCMFLCYVVSNLKLPVDIPLNTGLTPDWRVLLFALGATAVCAMLFGLVPIFDALKTTTAGALKGTTPSGRLPRWTMRDVMVAAQVALSIVLVTSSVLVVRSMRHALTMPLGFQPDGAVSVSFDLSLDGYSKDRGEAFKRELENRLEAVPGFKAIGIAGFMPLRIGQDESTSYREGQQRTPTNGLGTEIYGISPGYLPAMQTRLLEGRNFDTRDTAKSPRVALVNRTFAEKLFGTANAVGKRFFMMGRGLIQIVGVVEDGKYQTLSEDPTAVVFTPSSQDYNGWTNVIVRTDMPAAAAIEILRNTVAHMDANLPLFNVGSLRDNLSGVLLPARAAVVVLGAFGALALLLAATGLFAVVDYAVSRRKREIGLRMALGARPVEAVRLVATRTVLLWCVGAAVGLAGFLAAGRFLSAVLYGVKPRDPLSSIAALLCLAAVGALACWQPLRNAARTDPALTLREQ